MEEVVKTTGKDMAEINTTVHGKAVVTTMESIQSVNIVIKFVAQPKFVGMFLEICAFSNCW